MTRYCSKCGAELEFPFKFCVECGTPVPNPLRNKNELVCGDSVTILRRAVQLLDFLGCSISYEEFIGQGDIEQSDISEKEIGEPLQAVLKEKLDLTFPLKKNDLSKLTRQEKIEESSRGTTLRDGEHSLLNMDYDKAASWYLDYLESNGDKTGFIYNAMGMISLYQAKVNGSNSDRDYQDVLAWIKKSVECKNVLGQLNMGKLYENGVGVEKNSTEALRYYLRAYSQGSVYAKENLSRFLDKKFNLIEVYENGCRIENVSDYDYTVLADRYEGEADRMASALLKIGYMYHHGLGRKKSLTKARACYQEIISSEMQSCEEYPFALCFLGDIYFEGCDSVPTNNATALEYWEKAASENNRIGLLRMGDAYNNGWGVSENKDKAIEYYRASGNANSWYELGLVCKLDNVVNNYIEKALHQDIYNDDAEYKCFQKSSELGSIEGTNLYATMFLKGWAGKRWEKDPQKAFFIMSQAAELGAVSSLFCLGEMYESGTGCYVDKRLALDYFRKAEKGGHTKAGKKIKSMDGDIYNSYTLTTEAYQKLQKLIGLKKVKREIDEVINEAKIIKEMHEKGLPDGRGAYHMVFTGNPGTGKTEVARLVAAIFKEHGIISQGQLVEVDRSKLVAAYVGQTATKTQEVIEAAIGGVLFIDEAYSLYKESDNDFGQEAIDTILKEMEDRREDLIVIAAGYENPMFDFLHSNPGLESRFRRIIHFDDYTTDELMQIFEKICNDNGNIIDEAVEEKVLQKIKKLVYFKTDTFGNARDIRKVYEDIIRRQRNRLSINGDDHTKEELLTIRLEDIPEENAETDINQYMSELDSLIGLDEVKGEIRDLADLIAVQNERREMGIDNSLPSLHMVFTGNPGTGKTTVARLVAKIYQSLGVLSKGTLTEASRADLVAGYSGQTAIKTKDIISKSIGGVLFIDEAYSLVQSAEDIFGQEAIDTLLKEMEDHRNNLAVIVAGYTDEMHQFVKTNAGLASRFNRYIKFADYDTDQLVQIFISRCTSEQYTPADDLLEELREYLWTIDETEFANGRGIRNLFEKLLTQQAKRILEEKNAGKEMHKEYYLTLTAEDLKNVLSRI